MPGAVKFRILPQRRVGSYIKPSSPESRLRDSGFATFHFSAANSEIFGSLGFRDLKLLAAQFSDI